jgi:hypothetical protein
MKYFVSYHSTIAYSDSGPVHKNILSDVFEVDFKLNSPDNLSKMRDIIVNRETEEMEGIESFGVSIIFFQLLEE